MKGGAVVESGKVFDIFANPKEAITREFVENTTNLSKITELVETHKELLNIQPGEVVLGSSYIKRDAFRSTGFPDIKEVRAECQYYLWQH